MADPTPNLPEPDDSTEVAQPQSRRRGIIIVVVVILALVAAAIWWRSTFTEDTDDAQVNGHLIQVSSRIGGQVAKVYVDENQVVKAGDPIADLDPADYKVAVENAEAALASAQANNQYVTSLYRHNVAKLSLARALGAAENYKNYLGGK